MILIKLTHWMFFNRVSPMMINSVMMKNSTWSVIMKNNTEFITLVNMESVRYPVYVHPVAQSMGNVLSIMLSMSNFFMKKDTQLLLEALKTSLKMKPFLMRATLSSMLVFHLTVTLVRRTYCIIRFTILLSMMIANFVCKIGINCLLKTRRNYMKRRRRRRSTIVLSVHIATNDFVNHLLLRNTEFEHNLAPFKCDPCAKTFHSRQEKDYHDTAEHSTAEVFEKCNMCGKLLASKISLRNHMKYVHSDERKYSCKK